MKMCSGRPEHSSRLIATLVIMVNYFMYLFHHTHAANGAYSRTQMKNMECVGCGGELSGLTGSFVSPNHPLPYGHAAECFWNITVSRGSKIRLQFLEFHLERHSMCYFDYVEVSFFNAFVHWATAKC